MKNSKDKGELGESLFLYKMLEINIPVSKPFGDNQQYDFIIDINNKLYKVQVKTGLSKENILSFLLHTSYYSSKKKKIYYIIL